MQLKSFDIAIVGSSPLALMVGLEQAKKGKSVAVVESSKRLGGAWYTEDLWGHSNLEVGCHTLKNDTHAQKIIKSYQLPLETLDPQPGVLVAKPGGITFMNALLNFGVFALQKLSGQAYLSKKVYDLFQSIKGKKTPDTPYKYFPGGCSEIVQGLVERLKKMGATLILDENVALVSSLESTIDLKLDSQNIQVDQLFLTRNFNIEKFDLGSTKVVVEEKQLIGEHFVLRINGNKKSPFCFLHVFEDDLINLISDTGMYLSEPLNDEHIICVSTKARDGIVENNLIIRNAENALNRNQQENIANELFEKLKSFGLFSSQNKLIDFKYETYPIHVKGKSQLEEIKRHANNITFLDSTDLMDSISKYCTGND